MNVVSTKPEKWDRKYKGKDKEKEKYRNPWKK
jgi:hypothetical protein